MAALRKSALLFSGLLALPAMAIAQTATFTVKDGRALVLGGETDLGLALSPTALGPAAIVDAFDKLCLPDPVNAGSRAADSPLVLRPSQAVLPAQGKLSEARIPVWTSASATLTVWDGVDGAWKGRPIAMPSRALVTTGPYGAFKAAGVQCNLVIMVADFGTVTAVSDALSAKYGAPGKLVVKKTFADGFWQNGDLRINFNAPSTRVGPHPLHLSAQVIPAKGTS
jgi:hypothetical protein